jgi:hypothetical protein
MQKRWREVGPAAAGRPGCGRPIADTQPTDHQDGMLEKSRNEYGCDIIIAATAIPHCLIVSRGGWLLHGSDQENKNFGL